MEQKVWEFFNALDSIKRIANHYGLKHQIGKAKEELQELYNAISDYQLGPMTEEDKSNIITEIADVEIMTAQLKYLLEIDGEVDDEKLYKLNRQLKRMENEK